MCWRAEGRIERRNHRARPAKVRRPQSVPWVIHVRRIHQHRVLVVLVVLRHGRVVRVMASGVRLWSVM